METIKKWFSKWFNNARYFRVYAYCYLKDNQRRDFDIPIEMKKGDYPSQKYIIDLMASQFENTQILYPFIVDVKELSKDDFNDYFNKQN